MHPSIRIGALEGNGHLVHHAIHRGEVRVICVITGYSRLLLVIIRHGLDIAFTQIKLLVDFLLPNEQFA